MFPCIYCSASADEAWILTEEAVALPHPSPLTNCHMVVAPRRHVLTFYDLDVQEQRMVWNLVAEIQNRIAGALKIQGFHVGFADGSDDDPIHAHIHVIPQSDGESLELPRGVDWVNA